MITEINAILKEIADGGFLIGSNVPPQYIQQIVEVFQKWLIDQAHKDCLDGKDYRQTRAFDLSNRLLKEL